VREAKQSADFAVFAVHTHEPGNFSAAPPPFLPELAQAAVDAGADVVLGHGPHQLRGIEVYRGRPIFYSLGNFVFRANTQPAITREAWDRERLNPATTTPSELLEHKRVAGVFAEQIWYESIVAECRFAADGTLREARLYPVELHWNTLRHTNRGIPRTATGEAAARILRRLQRLSEPFGTSIAVDGDVGLIVRRGPRAAADGDSSRAARPAGRTGDPPR
jgi:hypothetical protein